MQDGVRKTVRASKLSPAGDFSDELKPGSSVIGTYNGAHYVASIEAMDPIPSDHKVC